MHNPYGGVFWRKQRGIVPFRRENNQKKNGKNVQNQLPVSKASLAEYAGESEGVKDMDEDVEQGLKEGCILRHGRV